MIPENVKKQILSKYSNGEERLYKYLLTYALERIIDRDSSPYQSSPELELIDLHDKFLVLYRREGEDNYLHIARVCRKAAHKIYRLLIKRNLIERNAKFLNLVE